MNGGKKRVQDMKNTALLQMRSVRRIFMGSDRRGQCGSGQRDGETLQPTSGNRSAAAGAGSRGRILFVECSKLTLSSIQCDQRSDEIASGSRKSRSRCQLRLISKRQRLDQGNRRTLHSRTVI